MPPACSLRSIFLPKTSTRAAGGRRSTNRVEVAHPLDMASEMTFRHEVRNDGLGRDRPVVIEQSANLPESPDL